MGLLTVMVMPPLAGSGRREPPLAPRLMPRLAEMAVVTLVRMPPPLRVMASDVGAVGAPPSQMSVAELVLIWPLLTIHFAKREVELSALKVKMPPRIVPSPAAVLLSAITLESTVTGTGLEAVPPLN